MSKKPLPEIQSLALDGEAFSIVYVGHLDPDYRRNPKTQHFCCLCQRDIDKPLDETQYLHYVDGGESILMVADEDRYQALSAKQYGGQFPGEMGCFPVGPECAKKLPPGFVLPAKAPIP